MRSSDLTFNHMVEHMEVEEYAAVMQEEFNTPMPIDHPFMQQFLKSKNEFRKEQRFIERIAEAVVRKLKEEE